MFFRRVFYVEDMYSQNLATAPFVNRSTGGASLLRGVLAMILVLTVWSEGVQAHAQQKIGYVDSQRIMEQLPEYATVQQKLEKLETQWRDEIQKKREQVQQLQEEYRAWELLYTEEERAKKRKAIDRAQREVEQLRQKYFGPEGRLYTQQKELMRPIQERVLNAAEEVATTEGYDFVLDKAGKVLFMYAREEHNLTQSVLQELGINPEQATSGRQ